MAANFTLGALDLATPFPHVWEGCIGSHHAECALRADWRSHAELARDELGMQRIRCHGWLSDGMRVGHGQRPDLRWNFFLIDSLCDYFLTIGMKPFIGLCFTPEVMATGNRHVFFYHSNVTPPYDLAVWSELHEALGRHLVDRYGVNEVSTWMFEVWNEPNESQWFWQEGMATYFDLYAAAARGLRRAHGGIKVGGPATSRCGWISEMISFCDREGVPLDYVSTHQYPTDTALHPTLDIHHDMGSQPRNSMQTMLMKARMSAGKRPLHVNEWNCSPSPTSLFETGYAAAFAIRTIAQVDGLCEMYGFWNMSDIGGIDNRPFVSNMGALTPHGIRKPVYRALEWLHGVGTKRVPVEGLHETVEALAVLRDETLEILLTNWERPGHAIAHERVRMSLRGIEPSGEVTLHRIDDTCVNPRRLWEEELGSPDHLDRRQLQVLHEASCVRAEGIKLNPDGRGGPMVEFDIPPQGSAKICIPCRRTTSSGRV